MRALLLLLSACLTVAAVFYPAWQLSVQRNIHAVDTPEGWLPVLVFASGDVNLLSYDELSDFTKAHPDYSFLVPQGREKLMQERLATIYRDRAPSAGAIPKFEVRQLSENRQSLELGIYGDGETIVWYEATAKEIFPRRYEMLGPLFPLIPLFWSVVVSLVIWGLVYGLLKIYRETGGVARGGTV